MYFHVLIPDLSLNICTWDMIFKSGGIQQGMYTPQILPNYCSCRRISLEDIYYMSERIKVTYNTGHLCKIIILKGS
jgi:hypothetical protein